MPHRRALPPSLLGRPFGLAEAIELGVGVGRLRGDDLSRPFRAVRMPHSTVATVDALAHAYATRMPPHHFFSHWTAAELLGLRLPEGRVPGGLDVAVVQPNRAPRLPGVRGHQLLRGARTVVLPNGLRVSHPVEVWCQLAAELGHDDLVVLGDGLVRRQRPFATMDDLIEAIDAWGHRPGVAALRAAVADVRCRTDSARETMLRLIIVRAGLPEPVVNHEIVNRYGAVIGIGDLAYPEYRVLIEYDGGVHLHDERQFHRDVERLDDFMEEKWRVIRVNKALMHKRAVLIGKVRTALEDAGWRG